MKNHCSDNDFCIRAGVLGYKVIFVPASEVFHDHQTTTNSLNLQATEDQSVLLQKIRCDYQRMVLESYKLDADSDVWHELIFREKE